MGEMALVKSAMIVYTPSGNGSWPAWTLTEYLAELLYS